MMFIEANMKKVTKHKITIFEKEYEELLITESKWDDQRAMAYHNCCGLLVGDWMHLVREYCDRNNRKYFFGINDYGYVCVFFDCESTQEFQDLLSKKFRDESAKEPQLKFLHPLKKRSKHGQNKE